MILEIASNDRPFLPRGVRIQKDRIRGGMVLLAPEKAIALDTTGEAILSRVNGINSFDEIVTDLAKMFNAPKEVIETDVQNFLIGLRARMFIAVHS